MPPRAAARTTPAPRRAGSRASRPTAIVNLQDPGRISHHKWWLYGASGVGKTVLVGSVPHKHLIITTDVEGTASAKAFGSKADELRVNTWAEYVAFHEWFVAEGYTEYPWLSLDTVDELEELCWQAQLVDPTMKRFSKYQPNKADYPVVWRKVREHVMELNRLSVNVIYTSHAMRIDTEDEDGEDTVTMAMPLVGSTKRGDLSSYLCAQMALVGYMRSVHSDDGKEVRKLYTSAGGRWVAKDRYDAFGKGLLNPTVPVMLQRIEARQATTASTTAAPRRRARRATR